MRRLVVASLIAAVIVAAGVLLVDSVGVPDQVTGAVSRVVGPEDPPDRPESGRTVYIRSVTSGAADGGSGYSVRPTRAGRLAAGDQLDVAWQQAVALGLPDEPGLRQQFMCHPLSIVARAKPTWDLEPWRPTVGLARTMLAGCNPE